MTDHAPSPAALLGAVAEDERLRRHAGEHTEPERSDPASCRALPWIERAGFVIYGNEAAFLATFERLGSVDRLRTDGRYFTLVIEAMRLGPHTTLAALSEATGVPRGTISSYQHRFPDLKTALDLLRRGPVMFLDEVLAGRYTIAQAIRAVETWPGPRWMYEPETRTAVELAREQAETAEFYSLGGLEPPPPPDEEPPNPIDVDALYAVADRHWRCPWLCAGPHLPGEEPRAHIFTLDGA